jgi:sugar lactone lactonase YvrE
MNTDLAGNVQVVATFDDHTSGLGFLPSGDCVVVLRKSRLVMQIHAGGATRVYADLTALGGDNLNDMIVDQQGRAYVDLIYDARLYEPKGSGPAEELGADCIVLIDPDGGFMIAAGGLGGPNGLAISGDGKKLLVGETRAHRLRQFRIDESTGCLSEPTVFAELGDVRPDGICLDAEGAVWAASPFTGYVHRILEGGECTDSISVEGKMPTAVILAGSERRTLFMMIGDTIPEKVGLGQFGIGSIEFVEVAVAGDGLP